MRKKASDQLLREAESTEKAEKDMKSTIKDSSQKGGKRERGAHLNLDDIDEGDEPSLCECMCVCVYVDCMYVHACVCMCVFMCDVCACCVQMHTCVRVHACM
jgi:hypothetical protein